MISKSSEITLWSSHLFHKIGTVALSYKAGVLGQVSEKLHNSQLPYLTGQSKTHGVK